MVVATLNLYKFGLVDRKSISYLKSEYV